MIPSVNVIKSADNCGHIYIAFTEEILSGKLQWKIKFFNLFHTTGLFPYLLKIWCFQGL